MKIVDLQVIPFWVASKPYVNGAFLPEEKIVQTVTKIITDEGAEGYYFGGHRHGDLEGLSTDERAVLEGRIKSLVLGQDPYDREKFWQLMFPPIVQENLLSVLDMALWDLQARAFGVPVHKLLGGCREKVKAYASSFPSMGGPEVYAKHASQCKHGGYKAYKIHPHYYSFDPITKKYNMSLPSPIDQQIATCRLVRKAVGDDMVLMYDPWGTYRTYEEALKMGRALEELNFYWYEHPMQEYRVKSYIQLAAQLDIPILSPEIAEGSIYTRADWISRNASDMSRIDVLRGGITGCRKMAAICEAFGIRLELHMSGFGNLQILAATSESLCEYYERGLEAPGLDYDVPQPYLEEICDPLDADGYVRVPQEPGMGYKIRWDYINDNLVHDIPNH
jgi:L-alanine-DL-glutamate epimerase-like enolase superfamily enzyme